LFAVETVLTRPHLFTRLLVLAPAPWAGGATIRLAQERVASGFDPSLRVFLAIGSADNPAFVTDFKQLSAVFESKKFEQLRVKSRILTDRRHANVVVPAARDGLTFVYADTR
jgi:predicted alpha/beta superfamily hydrolase